MSFTPTALLCSAALLTSALCHAALPLATAGQPVAEIICPADAGPVLAYAAKELQEHIAMISGATLPILPAPGPAAGRIILAVQPVGFANDREQIGDSDGFAVRQQGTTVTVLGNQPKGVLTGVYKLLFRNSDIIWARPNTEFGTIFTPNADLTLTDTDFIDVPATILRGWQMIGPGLESDVWQYRQGSNWSSRTMRDDPETSHFGCVREFGGGHNLTGLYIRGDKYFADHPEFFPFFKGARQDPRQIRMRTQLCFTNADMTRAFISELDQLVAASPDYSTYRIMIEDVWQCCECPECSKPITLPDGTSVAPADEDFRSTQFFLWLNQIARHFQAHYPGKRLLTFGYFFTETPPRITVEPNISISFCPINKNSKRAIDDPDNDVYYRRFLSWMKNTTELTWREYFGLCGPFPRPMDAIAIADWRLVNSYGVRRTYSEMYSDAVGPRMDGVASWNVNAPYFWVMANANWNPKVDVNALRDEFFRRVYGPAADDVKAFYAMIEKAFLAAPGNSRWNDRAQANWKHVVIAGDLVEPCRQALTRAAQHPLLPKQQRMLSALRDQFDAMIADVLAMRVFATKVATPPTFDPTFATEPWLSAKVADAFVLSRGGKPHENRTELRVLYDDERLYFGVRCFHPDPANMPYRKDVAAGNRFPQGEGFEVFLQGDWDEQKSPFVQMVIDPAGNRYAGARAGKSWQAESHILADGWSAMLSLTWAEARLAPPQPGAVLRGAFIRQFMPSPQEGIAPSNCAALYGSTRHRTQGFCDIILE